MGIIDFGAGNFLSVERAFRHLGAEPIRVDSPEKVTEQETPPLTHLVFPGVGRAAQAMKALRSAGLDGLIVDHAAAGRPLLGICVGMQLLGRATAEDETQGLGILDFALEHFSSLGVVGSVPHMGWNSVRIPEPQHAATGLGTQSQAQSEGQSQGLSNFSRTFHQKDVYFVHSYAAPLKSADPAVVRGVTDYGGVTFASVVGKANVLGTQFHVEKSGNVGLEILRAFLTMEGPC